MVISAEIGLSLLAGFLGGCSVTFLGTELWDRWCKREASKVPDEWMPDEPKMVVPEVKAMPVKRVSEYAPKKRLTSWPKDEPVQPLVSVWWQAKMAQMQAKAEEKPPEMPKAADLQSLSTSELPSIDWGNNRR